jgi:hypothetical protein
MALLEGLDGFLHRSKCVIDELLKRLSSILTAIETGKAKGFYTDTECQGDHSGIVSAHGRSFPYISFSTLLRISLTSQSSIEYYDTKIVLSQADPTWGPSPSNHMMACADKISTPDGGKTWIIPTIKVSQSIATKDYDGKNPPGLIICK